MRVIDPVGVGFPDPPLTVTPTDRDWVTLIVEDAGFRVTVGVIVPEAITDTSVVPEALEKVEELPESGE